MFTNNVEAFDAEGKSLGVVFETATPFETPMMMEELVGWYNAQASRAILDAFQIYEPIRLRYQSTRQLRSFVDHGNIPAIAEHSVALLRCHLFNQSQLL
ncbi:hypothetical protein IMCC3135_02815 [Granulosicoccus antarcticus IMCC3135]|uniref:Uncharacterized protein n=1 Tax=Granulosicoccus antarcticus IMCC3135 TaxID=1192854 RepID=A0A2Z2NHA4_9GAMM|nr:hypothetical protein IMCC3135_02815 [Granulosicoccus antarcticus IMCC3135]